MIKIRQEQMKMFENDALRHFEDEMVLHSKEFSPRLCEILGDDQLRIALRQVMNRADTYGFTNRGSIRLYIELMFLYGSNFDTDPQYSMSEILNASQDQMQRAEQLHQGVLHYQKKVSGQDNINVHDALKAVSIFAGKPVTISTNNFENEMHKELVHAFPQKAAYVGQSKLNRLIMKGNTEAQKYGFSTVRGRAMMVILMFSFGYGCTNDPLYPWISRTLYDERINDSGIRAKRLEKRAVTWLNAVLFRVQKGGQI